MTAVISGDLPSTQNTDAAQDIVEPVVVAPEPTPDASNDLITTAAPTGSSTAAAQAPAKAKSSPYKSPPLPPPPAPVAFPNAAEAALAADFGFSSAAAWLQHRRVELGQEGFATVPRPARPGEACPPATSPARLEEIQRQIDAELASDPSMAPSCRRRRRPPPARRLPPSPPRRRRRRSRPRTRSWTGSTSRLQETRDNARAAARLEAAVAAQGEAYVAYKARVERRGARAEHLPAPLSDLAQLLVSTYGDLVRREEATADGAVMPRAAEAPYWVLTALPPGVWGGRIPGEHASAGRFIVGWCAHRCSNPACRLGDDPAGRRLRPIVLGPEDRHSPHFCAECHHPRHQKHRREFEARRP